VTGRDDSHSCGDMGREGVFIDLDRRKPQGVVCGGAFLFDFIWTYP